VGGGGEQGGRVNGRGVLVLVELQVRVMLDQELAGRPGLHGDLSESIGRVHCATSARASCRVLVRFGSVVR
jgi:hypothetical protein